MATADDVGDSMAADRIGSSSTRGIRRTTAATMVVVVVDVFCLFDVVIIGTVEGQTT